MWLSGISDQEGQQLYSAVPVGQHYKATMSAHCHKSVPIPIWPQMLLGCKTQTTTIPKTSIRRVYLLPSLHIQGAAPRVHDSATLVSALRGGNTRQMAIYSNHDTRPSETLIGVCLTWVTIWRRSIRDPACPKVKRFSAAPTVGAPREDTIKGGRLTTALFPH